MEPIPLIAAEHVARVAGLLDGLGVPAERYLEGARISPAICEAPAGFVPGRSVWHLAPPLAHASAGQRGVARR